ncbi:MAG TPA: hypothetical protein VEA38_00845 [Terriglobales bacterium]|nr:hypothetical protein [Terriglobales bacterium]
MAREHGAQCRCADCRHARFAPGPASTSRSSRSAINFYGHFKYRKPELRVGGGNAPLVGVQGYQVRGPIAYGPPDFIAGAFSKNRHLSAPPPTVRFVTPTPKAEAR